VISEDATEGATTHVAANGINEALLKQNVLEIEEEQDAIDAIMAEAQKKCQPHVDHIKAVKKRAAEDGIPKKPLAAALKKRTLLGKAEHVDKALNPGQRDIFSEIWSKLSDLKTRTFGDEAEAFE